MSHTNAPAEPSDVRVEPDTVGSLAPPPRLACVLSPASRHVASGVARRPAAPETIKLVAAFSIALALGAACGLWIHARFARAALTAPSARALGAEPTASTSSRGDAAGAAPVENGPGAAEDEGRAAPATAAAGAAPTPKAAKPSGAEPNEQENAPARAAAARGQEVSGPCRLYVSSGSLKLPVGGASLLVVGGAPRVGAVTVTTPDWSNIAVLPEGQAKGGKGWLRYSVRSVSQRPGRYAVRVKTGCGSETVSVAVGRP